MPIYVTLCSRPVLGNPNWIQANVYESKGDQRRKQRDCTSINGSPEHVVYMLNTTVAQQAPVFMTFEDGFPEPLKQRMKELTSEYQ